MPRSQEEMDKLFMYHSPKGDQSERYELLRAKAKEFAQLIDNLVPDSREKSVAFTQLETACFWANAAIARSDS